MINIFYSPSLKKTLSTKNTDRDIAWVNDLWSVSDVEMHSLNDNEDHAIVDGVFTKSTLQYSDVIQEKRIELINKLTDLDLKAIRALRENDTARIASYNTLATSLRTQLQAIG